MSCEIVIIGASWGGLHALGAVLAGLPRDFPAPLVLVQHRAEGGDELLADLLGRRGPIAVAEAQDKDPLSPGRALLAPPGYHLLVERDHVALSTEAAVRFNRPSVDLAFESAAKAYGAGALAVVLTGANEDGAAGAAEVRRRGGVVLVQDPATAESPRMPAAAAAAVEPDGVLALEDIAGELVRQAGAVPR